VENIFLSKSINKPQRLGLLSDSHGNFDATEKAIDILSTRDCDLVIHLGDFCDTSHREHMGKIFRLFQERDIIAVKGNNDYLIELALQNGAGDGYSDLKGMYEFLKDIPMKVVMDDICFAHSFPFDYLRAFYEPIDVGSTERASLLFGQMPYRILFCGHSHSPIYFRLNHSEDVLRQEIPLRKKLLLESTNRYIFVIGSADEGECAVFDTKTSTYERIKIFS
jgi:putative phosphoesterase